MRENRVCLDSTALGPTESMAVQNFRAANIDNAGIIVEIFDGDPIRNLLCHFPSFRQDLKFDIGLDVGSVGLPR